MLDSVICKENYLFFEKGKEYKIENYSEYHPGKISALCLKVSDTNWWITDDELGCYFFSEMNQIRKYKLKKLSIKRKFR